MTSMLDLSHFRSNKSLARKDRRVAKDIYSLIKQTDESFKKIKHYVYVEVDTEKTYNGIISFLNLIHDESSELNLIRKHALSQDYDLIKKIKELHQNLKGKSEDSLNILENLEQKTYEVIRKQKLMVEKLKNNYNSKQNKYSAVFGFSFVAGRLIRTEKKLKKLVKKSSIPDLKKSFTEDIGSSLKTFDSNSRAILEKVYIIEHDIVILLFHIHNQFKKLDEMFNYLDNERFNKTYLSRLRIRYNSLLNEIKTDESEIVELDKYIEKKIKQVA